MTISTFPLLHPSKFEEAIQELEEIFSQNRTSQSDWLSATTIQPKWGGTKYLRITKPFPNTPIKQDSDAEKRLELDEEEIEEEEDDEALPTLPSSTSAPIIEYDILLSPTYQVPVLYLNIKDPLHRFPLTIDTIYQYIVPPQFKNQVSGVGVMGGITGTDHPVFCTPVFFVHPCRTVEAMKVFSGNADSSPLQYLKIWMGVIGGSVGLFYPTALSMVE